MHCGLLRPNDKQRDNKLRTSLDLWTAQLKHQQTVPTQKAHQGNPVVCGYDQTIQSSLIIQCFHFSITQNTPISKASQVEGSYHSATIRLLHIKQASQPWITFPTTSPTRLAQVTRLIWNWTHQFVLFFSWSPWSTPLKLSKPRNRNYWWESVPVEFDSWAKKYIFDQINQFNEISKSARKENLRYLRSIRSKQQIIGCCRVYEIKHSLIFFLFLPLINWIILRIVK